MPTGRRCCGLCSGNTRVTHTLLPRRPSLGSAASLDLLYASHIPLVTLHIAALYGTALTRMLYFYISIATTQKRETLVNLNQWLLYSNMFIFTTYNRARFPVYTPYIHANTFGKDCWQKKRGNPTKSMTRHSVRIFLYR